MIPAMGGTTRRVSPAQVILPPPVGGALATSTGRRTASFWLFRRIDRKTCTLRSRSSHLPIQACEGLRRRPVRRATPGPAFSPDGIDRGFCARNCSGSGGFLYIVPVAGSEPKRLTFDNAWTFGPPAWVPDGRSMVFSSARGGQPSLWRISTSGGTPERVPGVGMMVANPTLSLIGTQLAFKQMNFRRNIRQRNLKDQKNREGLSAIVTSDKGAHTGRAQFSPDGKRIVFESDRMGTRTSGLATVTGQTVGN